MDKIIQYSFWRRVGYANRNHWFTRKFILGVLMPHVPTNQDIHVHNAWKDIQKKHKRNLIPQGNG